MAGLIEQSIISQYFTGIGALRNDVSVGVGDDCAIVTARDSQSIAVTSDVLVEGVHFAKHLPADLVASKSVHVNASDLAAMGAAPAWCSLSLMLPHADTAWLQDFSQALDHELKTLNIALIGGDLTRGPLTVSITMHGLLKQGNAILRSGAQVEDDIYVSGTLGLAALGLAHTQGAIELPHALAQSCLAKLHFPKARLALGTALVGLANSAIDISDGLLLDCQRLCEASTVAACVHFARLPHVDGGEALPNEWLKRSVLSGGDDYELLFTAAPTQREAIADCAQSLALPIHRIGRIQQGSGVSLLGEDGASISIDRVGYEHWS